MAVRPAESSLAIPGPSQPPVVIPIRPRQQKRLRLFDALVEAGCEILAHASTAIKALAQSREPDAAHDRHVIAVRRLAIRGAEESAAIYECGCWRAFRAINDHALEAQRHDNVEDWLIVKAFAAIGRIGEIARGLNRTLTRELAKRKGGRR